MISIKAEIDSLFRKLKPIYGERIEKIYRAYQLEDADGRAEIEQQIRSLDLRSLKKGVDHDQVLLVPPSPETAKGQYPIGKVLYADKEVGEFGLREKEWCQHIALFGRSGSGKTNTAYFLVGTLLKKKKPFLILDWKKNFRPLVRLNKKSEILVFTVGKEVAPFRFNPLIPPPGCEPSSYLKKLIDVIGESTYVGEGVQCILQKAMDKLYKKHHVYAARAEQYPTMRDVLEEIESKETSGRAKDWMASTRRAIGALCFGGMGNAIETQSNRALEDLLQKNVVLELDSLTAMDKSFFIQTLLLWIHHYRMNVANRDRFELALIIEEAHHILKKQVGSSKESIVELLLREVREFGVSITLIDQSPGLISPVALANTYTTFTMSLKSDADVRTAANYLLMDTEERKMLGQLPTGQAIVKLQGRTFKPFLIQIPYAPLKDSYISDKEVQEHMRTYFKDSKLTPTPLPQKGERKVIPLRDKEEELKEKQRIPIKETTEERDIENRIFLKDIFEYPYSSITERYKRLSLSRRRGNSLKESSIHHGWIEAIETHTRNGRLMLLKLNKQGMNRIEKEYDKQKLQKYISIARCLVHEYWKHRLAKHYQNQGYEVIIEKRINSEAVDLALQKNGMKTAVEIETGKSNYRKNIEKALNAGFDKILCIATEKSAENRIRQTKETTFSQQKDRIQVLSVTDLTLN